MKKTIILSLLIVLLIITGCGSNNKDNNTNYENIIKEGNKTAVIYFSATGNTRDIAKRIAEQSNSDLIEIIPKEEYIDDDLDYNSDCRANREQNDSAARPEIKNEIDISKYNTIFLGYPIWWGTNPKIILTLLDSYDFTNKTIIPFCTSGSSGISTSVNNLRNYNSNLTIKDGKRFAGNASDQEIIDFINSYIEINKEINEVKVTKDGEEYLINLEDNETAKAFSNMLPQEFDMSELNGNEKYIFLDKSLPTNSYYPERINAGDVMLYKNNCIVIFYKSFDTDFSYTKIGHIDNLPDLGSSNVHVVFNK